MAAINSQGEIVSVLLLAAVLSYAGPFRIPELPAPAPKLRLTLPRLSVGPSCGGFECADMRFGGVQVNRPLIASVNRILATRAFSDDQVSGVKGFDAASVHNPKRERFWSASNLLIGVAMFGSTVADVETSYSCFGISTTVYTVLDSTHTLVETYSCYEGNFHRRADYERGRTTVYPVNIAANSAVWVGTHFLRRSDKKILRILGWVAPGVTIFFQTKQAADNLGVIREIKSHR